MFLQEDSIMENANEKSPILFRIILTLIITIVMISLIIGIAIKLNKQVTRETLARYQQEQFVSVTHQSERLGDTLRTITNDLTMLSTHSELIEYQEKKARQRLYDFYSNHSVFVVAGYRMDKNGILTYVEGNDQAGEGIDISNQAHIKTLFKTKKTVISGSFKAVEGYYAVAIHVPVFKQGVLDGSLATLVKWDAFKAWFTDIQVSPNSFTMLLDADHKIISHPKSDYIGLFIEQTPAMTAKDKVVDPDFLFGSNTGTLSGPFFDGNTYVVASHPFVFEGVTYSLVRCAPYDDILAPISQTFALTMMLAGVGLLIVILGLIGFFYLFHTDKQHWLVYQKKVYQETLERKLAEQSLNETQDTFLTVLNSIDATVYAADMETYEILFMNRYMKDSFKREWKGEKCFKLFRNKNQPCSNCSNSRLLDETGKSKGVYAWEGENPITKKWYHNYDRAIRWMDGRMVRIQIATDVTEMKEYEKKQREMEIRLQRAEKMEAIGMLAGGVAHDLNNVLSGIVTYPELLLMDLPLGSPMVAPLQSIQICGQKAAEIVNDLLTLARRGVTVAEIVNLNDIVQEYFNSPDYDKLMAYHPDIVVEANIDDDLINMKGSPIHLRKTIMNLISNAVEAHLSSGSVLVETRNEIVYAPLKGYDSIKEGPYVVLTVTDQGTGISKEDIHRIYEPFYTKKVMGRSGTGLGMAVVWGAVQDHDGYICIDSQEGIGTTFSVYFPGTNEVVENLEQVIPINMYQGDQETILVVDDVKDQRAIASNILSKLNYSVAAVESGERAVDYLKEKSSDLLVLDMIMDPGMDGLETYKKILKYRPGQKAILASGFSETEQVKKAQDLGAGIYLKKPYRLEDLGMAVKAELQKECSAL